MRSTADRLAIAIERSRSRARLDHFARLVSGGLADGLLQEAEASRLYQMIELRRAGRSSDGEIRPRRYRRRTKRDRNARKTRRNMLGTSAPLPPFQRASYTVGELAVLCVIGEQANRFGSCAMSIKEIADRAGVSRTTVHTAVRLAVERGLLDKRERPMPGRRSLTNVLIVKCREWLEWLGKRWKSHQSAGSNSTNGSRELHRSKSKNI
jgi:DNA-binding MarR family transcriptional regulator